MNPAWVGLFQGIVTLFSSGALVLAYKAWHGRSKVKADGAASLSDAAIRQVDDMARDLAAAKTDIRNFRRTLIEHQRWDMKVIRRLEELGVTDIPDPPELWI